MDRGDLQKNLNTDIECCTCYWWLKNTAERGQYGAFMHCKHYNGQLLGNSIHGDVHGLKIYRGDAVTALQNTEKQLTILRWFNDSLAECRRNTPHNTKMMRWLPCRIQKNTSQYKDDTVTALQKTKKKQLTIVRWFHASLAECRKTPQEMHFYSLTV